MSQFNETTSGAEVVAAYPHRIEGRTCKSNHLAVEQTCTAWHLYGRTPLHSEEVVKELLDHWVDTSITDSKGRTALHIAAQSFSPDILELLVERGADIAARDDEGMTELHFAYQNGVTKMIDYLVEKEAKTDAKAKGGLTPESSSSQCVFRLNQIVITAASNYGGTRANYCL